MLSSCESQRESCWERQSTKQLLWCLKKQQASKQKRRRAGVKANGATMTCIHVKPKLAMGYATSFATAAAGSQSFSVVNKVYTWNLRRNTRARACAEKAQHPGGLGKPGPCVGSSSASKCKCKNKCKSEERDCQLAVPMGTKGFRRSLHAYRQKVCNASC